MKLRPLLLVIGLCVAGMALAELFPNVPIYKNGDGNTLIGTANITHASSNDATLWSGYTASQDVNMVQFNIERCDGVVFGTNECVLTNVANELYLTSTSGVVTGLTATVVGFSRCRMQGDFGVSSNAPLVGGAVLVHKDGFLIRVQ